jgi:hypothetical protein
MKKLKISIIDLIHNSPSHSLYRRYMFANYTSIMPQIIGVWCREEGHRVNYSIFTGSQKLNDMLSDEADLVFISSFTYTAQLAYAMSSYLRSRGIVTVLGGPHARSYPGDACKYFDYVIGITDRELLKELLLNFERNINGGVCLSVYKQPLSIPGVRERWEFIEKIHRSSNFIKVIPVIGSFGCPFKCNFCIDSEVDYQPLDTDLIKDDLRFLLSKMKHPRVGWYDPNFGIRFNIIMETIESVVPPGAIDFIAECSLSVLSEPNVRRLKKNGFRMVMPGIESWFEYGDKSKTGSLTGIDKVRRIADHVNMIQAWIPQVQTNFMLGLDSDSGPDPFELTKRFIDLAPAAYPSFALLSVYGQGVKDNVKYELEDRIIPFPFHLMRSVHTLNIVPKHYTWEDFYDHFVDLLKYSFSTRSIYRRFSANKSTIPRWITLLLSLTIGGSGKIRSLSSIQKNLQRDAAFRAFVRRETNKVPQFMIETVRKDLGPLWEWLPDKSLSYRSDILSGPLNEK